MKKLLCSLLAALLIGTLLVSCQQPQADNSDVSSEVSEEYVLFSNLPEKDFSDNGTPTDFTFLTVGDYANTYASVEICPNELSSELIQEAVFERNALVEQKFGVTIKEIRTTGNGEMVNLIRSNASAGTDLYDVVMPWMPDAASLALEGLFYNLAEDTSVVDFSGPWWAQDAKETMSIGNNLYFVTGDMNLLCYECTHCIVFNRDVVDELHLEDPYQLVYDGEWTIDKLLEISRTVSVDQDNGTLDSYDDRWGFLINHNYVTSMFIGAGYSLSGKDENDLPIVTVKGAGQTEAFNKIFDLCNDPAVGYIEGFIGKYPQIWDSTTEAVATGHCLFRAATIGNIQAMAEFECNFGVLPAPKLDKDQEDYRVNVSAVYCSCAAVPKTNKEYEKAVIILDAMCQAATGTVKTSYYDTLLKMRKLQDNDGAAMLDIIFDSRVYDYAIIFGWGGVNTFMNPIAFSGSNTFTSAYESIESKIQADLEKTIETLGK